MISFYFIPAGQLVPIQCSVVGGAAMIAFACSGCGAVLTASSGDCGGQNDSEGYCRVSSHETNDEISQSLTKAAYNVATACSVHKEYGNFSTEQHCQVRIDSPLVH